MPTTDSFGQGFAALDYGDVPDLKVMGDGLLEMAGQTVMRFASASTRNATLTSPVAGMAAWLSDVKQLTVYDGTQWIAAITGLTGWQSWTPTWATDTGLHLPVWGNASIRCKYMKMGTTVHFSMWIQFGSTTGFGTGATTADNWRFSLPVTAEDTGAIGHCSLFVGDGSKATSGMAVVNTTSVMNLYVGSGPSSGAAPTNAGVVDAITPFTWASGDIIAVVGTYEAAS